MTEKSRIFHTKDRCEKTWKLLQICAKMVYTEYSEAILLKKTLLHWFHGKIQTVLQKFCETKIRQFLYCTLWKLRKFNLTQKIFRQNTYLVISLVKFARLDVKHVTQCGNCAKSLSPTDFSVKSFFGKNQIPLLKECFSHIWIGTYEWHPLHIDCRWRYNLSIKVGFIHLCFFS